MQENFDQKYEWLLDIEDERSISTGIVVRCGSDMNSTTPNFFSHCTYFCCHLKSLHHIVGGNFRTHFHAFLTGACEHLKCSPP
jgi:hypothetical protein